jgi:signal transduction histidine kinase
MQPDLKKQWQAFFETKQLPAFARPLIVDSWLRSRAAGVDPKPQQLVFHTVAPEDLERRRNAHAELISCAASQVEWLSATLSNIAHAVYLCDEDGVVLFSAGDGEMRAQFGLLPGCQWCECLMGTNGAGTALIEGKPVAVFGAEHYVEAFQGTTCTAAPIHDPAGRVIGAIDVTSATADATPERLSLVSHATFVVERELRLLEEQRRAVDQTRRKDEFLAILAHEVRGPLNAITAGAEIIKACGDDGPFFETGKMLARQARLLNTIVSDLLDVARAAKGEIRIVRRAVDICQCVMDAAEGYRDAFARKRQELRMTIPNGAVIAEVDPTRVTEMVTNLISNASRYSPENGAIQLEVNARSGTVVIAVRDNGIGISEARLSTIFDGMVSGPNDEAKQGLGLGLWLTRRFAELHGGSVTASSAGIGKGAEFRIELPIMGSDK